MAQTVFVVGSTGYIGTAAIQSLASQFAATTRVKAGVRDPANEKAQKLKAANVEVVKASMDDVAGMKAAFKGSNAVFVVTPGHADRQQLAKNAVDAAKAAGVGYVLVVSVLTTGTDSIFGRQFGPLEAHIKSAGIKYGILRLPFFLDNLWGSQGNIKNEGKIYAPCRADAPWTPVAVADAGLAAATILADPSKHTNKIYNLTMKSLTYAEVAATFSKVLGKPIEFVQVPYEAAKATFLGFGMPEWQVDGVMELFRYFDAKSKITNNETTDIKTILGREPVTLEAWLTPVKGAFL